MNPNRSDLIAQVLNRIRLDFAEMPGLKLTSRQAQRLWGLDEETCARALHLLEEERYLCRTRPDTYARATEGPAHFPSPRPERAQLNPGAGIKTGESKAS